MPDIQLPATADVVSLDAARQRRHYIDLANAHPAWLEIKASWALEGIELADDNAVDAGRMIAGDITYAQLINELRIKHGQSNQRAVGKNTNCDAKKQSVHSVEGTPQCGRGTMESGCL